MVMAWPLVAATFTPLDRQYPTQCRRHFRWSTTCVKVLTASSLVCCFCYCGRFGYRYSTISRKYRKDRGDG
jgi:hypothetical protein